MRFSRIPPDGRQEIMEVARRRFELPTDKELAARWGVSIAWIQNLMQVARKRLVRKPIVDVLMVSQPSESTHDAE